MSSSSASSTPSASSTSQGVPRLGGVRCYWALVAPRYPNPAIPGSKLELVFVHPDPVLGVHLARQRLSLMGRGVLEFIHPGEREQARTDLGNAISADDLQGSVTRVRFARLSWIRKILGGRPDEVEHPYDAETFVEDDEYLILDIVLNWVADGLLLAFFHAIRDKDPVGNNDPARRNEEWTNWCGTAAMPDDQIEALSESVSKTIPTPPRTRYPPKRIFQLHRTESSSASVQPDSLVFSWPPSRPAGTPQVNDGSYDAEEYVGLARGVNMDPAQHPTGDDSRTTCTTRYGAVHSITTEGVYRQVSSVFIPYGSLIFAGFQTTKEVALHVSNPVAQTQPVLQPSAPLVPSSSDMTASTSRGSATGIETYGLMTPQQDWSQPPPAEWSRFPGMPSPSVSSTSYPPLGAAAPFPPAASYSDQRYYEQSGLRPPQPPELSYPTPAPSAPFVERTPPMPPGGLPPSRPLIRPPGDVDCCRHCGLRESPEWRRSESGVKDLCNACGLKLARQVAKREGRQKPRKKKDKEK